MKHASPLVAKEENQGWGCLLSDKSKVENENPNNYEVIMATHFHNNEGCLQQKIIELV